jgi:hypothetical protein
LDVELQNGNKWLTSAGADELDRNGYKWVLPYARDHSVLQFTTAASGE